MPLRHPINLIAGHLKRKRQQRAIRRVLLIASWVGLAFLGVDTWTSGQSWREEERQYRDLLANESKMSSEREHLVARNAAVQREREFAKQVDDDRLPPVAAKFTAYVASVLPDQMRLSELSVKWEEVGGWTFRLEGSVEGDEDTAREIVATLQRQLAKSPLHVRSNETARAVVPVMRSPNATTPEIQRFGIDGGILEK